MMLVSEHLLSSVHPGTITLKYEEKRVNKERYVDWLHLVSIRTTILIVSISMFEDMHGLASVPIRPQ